MSVHRDCLPVSTTPRRSRWEPPEMCGNHVKNGIFPGRHTGDCHCEQVTAQTRCGLMRASESASELSVWSPQGMGCGVSPLPVWGVGHPREDSDRPVPQTEPRESDDPALQPLHAGPEPSLHPTPPGSLSPSSLRDLEVRYSNISEKQPCAPFPGPRSGESDPSRLSRGPRPGTARTVAAAGFLREAGRDSVSGRQARVLPQPEKGHTTTSAVATHRKWATGPAHPLGLGSPTRALQQTGISGHPVPAQGRSGAKSACGA